MDYISREDAKTLLEFAVTDKWSLEYARKRFEQDIPSADVVERKTGKWLPKQGYNNVLYCSCCTSEVMGKTHTRNFCPNCGAKMEGNE